MFSFKNFLYIVFYSVYLAEIQPNTTVLQPS